jgi:predicted nucleic acid-binding protein
VVVAALIDTGPAGAWAEQVIGAGSLAAPHLMPVEAADVLRRAALTGDIPACAASLAHRDLTSLRLELFPYNTCASRVWELRENVTVYDACYVALAELLNAPRHPRRQAEPGSRTPERRQPPRALPLHESLQRLLDGRVLLRGAREALRLRQELVVEGDGRPHGASRHVRSTIRAHEACSLT